jgi:hypothetical protein
MEPAGDQNVAAGRALGERRPPDGAARATPDDDGESEYEEDTGPVRHAPGRKLGDRAERLDVQLMETMIYQHFALGWSAVYISDVNRTYTNVICEKTVRSLIKRFRPLATLFRPRRRAARPAPVAATRQNPVPRSARGLDESAPPRIRDAHTLRRRPCAMIGLRAALLSRPTRGEHSRAPVAATRPRATSSPIVP